MINDALAYDISDLVRYVINNYLLNGEKVKLFSRDKTRDILLFERSENNNSSRVLSSEKTLFRHLIRNFIFCTSLFAISNIISNNLEIKAVA